MVRLVYTWLVVVMFAVTTFLSGYDTSDSIDKSAYRVNNRKLAVDIVDGFYVVADSDDNVQYYYPDSKPYVVRL